MATELPYQASQTPGLGSAEQSPMFGDAYDDYRNSLPEAPPASPREGAEGSGGANPYGEESIPVPPVNVEPTEAPPPRPETSEWYPPDDQIS